MFNGGELSMYVEYEIVVYGHVGNVCLARMMMTEIACRPAFNATNRACFGQRTTAAVAAKVFCIALH